MSTQVIDRDELGLLIKIGRGGQGVVYQAARGRTRFAESIVYKEYKSATLGEVSFSTLSAMSSLVEGMRRVDAERLVSIAAWPCAIVQSDGKPVGFVMPQIPDSFFTSIRTVKGQERVPAEFQLLLNSSEFLAARGLSISIRERLQLMREAALALNLFHANSITVGDFSPKNLLFSTSPTRRVFFVDCDTMGVNGMAALPQLQTPGWEVPPGEELATTDADIYKLGLLALRIMLGDQDATDAQQLPDTIPHALRRLIADSLSTSRAKRPTASAWVSTVQTVLDDPALKELPVGSSNGEMSSSTPIVRTRPAGRPEHSGAPSQAQTKKQHSAQGQSSSNSPKGAGQPSGLPSVTGIWLSTNQKILTGVAGFLLVVIIGVVASNSNNSSSTGGATYTSAATSTWSSIPLWTSTSEWSTTTTPVVIESKYAAIALSPSTFAYGWGKNYPDQESAKAGAVSECSKRAADCEAYTWTGDGGCVAVAVDDGSGSYAGWYGSTLSEAESEALSRVRGSSPRVLTSVCNS